MKMTDRGELMGAVVVAAATAGAAPAGCGSCALRASMQDTTAPDMAARRRCVDRRAAARAAAEAVGTLLGVAPGAVSLLHRPNAAPLARVSGTIVRAGSACSVSIAHSRGRAVAAAAPPDAYRRIGIDLARAGAVGPTELRLFATGAEIAAGVDPTTLWALKEAAWKALSCGDTPFRKLEIGFRDGVVSHVSLDGATFAAAARVWTPWRGWIATLVSVAAVPHATEAAA